MQSTTNTSNDIIKVLESALKETGKDLGVSLDAVKVKIAEQLALLALAVGEPGYDRAVIAARDNVAFAMGLSAVADADAIDSRIIGVIQGGLSMGARLLA